VKLEELNNIPNPEAESLFRDCCGSREWAKRMNEARPFTSEEELFLRAGQIWWVLEPADWLEAFAAHPKIGAKKAAPSQAERAADWSKGEQAGMDEAAELVRDELARVNEEYEQKFGHIYIVCATGKTADEMLEICRARLHSDPENELPIAAEEQGKITEIRLRKLLETR
jgi:OHCU decarboxylase